MTKITIAWLVLPLLGGFLIYLFPKSDRYLALGITIISALYSIFLLLSNSEFNLQLLDSFGVTLLVDELSGYFILTNALVNLAVLLYCWSSNRNAFFYTQAIILQGSINSIFVCADLISVYVALEVCSIAAFSLITYPRSDRSIWVGLRYLLISNVAMLFYLIGAVLVYQAHHSFNFSGLEEAPPEAIALIFLGLLTKGGIFVSGMWLPLTHAEVETPISALLSGISVKAGVFPLVRAALMVDDVDGILRILAIATTFLGAFYAIFEKDTKRTLAFSTISQLGWILSAPPAAGFFALAHGLAKACVFLTAGTLPSRDFQELKQQKINPKLWLILLIAGLSISGFPLLVGFSAKALSLGYMLPWQNKIMTVAAVLTAIIYAKFIFLPFGGEVKIKPGFWLGVSPLVIGLFVTNVFYLDAYTLVKIVKSIAIIALGWLAYALILRQLKLNIPHVLEELEHLIGVMSLILIVLFWMVMGF